MKQHNTKKLFRQPRRNWTTLRHDWEVRRKFSMCSRQRGLADARKEWVQKQCIK